MSAQRHPATTDAWDWLEKGEGKELPEERRAWIAEQLRSLDEIFIAWDHEHGWPEPAPLPADYWETAG